MINRRMDSCIIDDLERLIMLHMKTYQIGAGVLTLCTPRGNYHCGYGTSPGTVMRVASISKSITAAILREGRLGEHLEETLYSFYQRRGRPLPEPLDERAKRITLQHLLDHTSGFDNEHIGCDPVAAPVGVLAQCSTLDQLLSYILTHFTLASDPGTRYSYSNLSYCILGRVIELETGRPYIEEARYVLQSRNVYLGKFDTRCPNEIETYDIVPPDGPYPLERLTGAGNLVVGSNVLASYALSHYIIGENIGKPITERTQKSFVFWGSLPGTDAYLFSGIDGWQKYSLCIIFNKRVPDQDTVTEGFLNSVKNFLSKHFNLSFPEDE